jgi:hypothetical protein
MKKIVCMCIAGLSVAVLLALVLAWRCAAITTFFAVVGIIMSLSNAIAMAHIADEMERKGK